jgi:Leucine-rich repeat (LRR) protein
LTELPEAIRALKSLNILHLENCSLDDMLKQLAVGSNRLTCLPASIGNIGALDSIPEGPGNLTKLTWLNIYNDDLVELPKDVTKLRKLQTLLIKRIDKK